MKPHPHTSRGSNAWLWLVAAALCLPIAAGSGPLSSPAHAGADEVAWVLPGSPHASHDAGTAASEPASDRSRRSSAPPILRLRLRGPVLGASGEDALAAVLEQRPTVGPPGVARRTDVPGEKGAPGGDAGAGSVRGPPR